MELNEMNMLNGKSWMEGLEGLRKLKDIGCCIFSSEDERIKSELV